MGAPRKKGGKKTLKAHFISFMYGSHEETMGGKVIGRDDVPV